MANNGTILMIAFPEVPSLGSDHHKTMLKPRRQKYRQQKRRELRQQQATNNILSGTDPRTQRFHQDIINLKQDVIKIKKDRPTSRSFVDTFNKKLQCSRLCPVLHQSRFGRRKRTRLLWGVHERLWRTQPLRHKAYIRVCLDDESELGCFEEFMRDYEELNL